MIAFNLDEYYGIKKDDINSYHHFMNENLFDHIDIPKENINIPSGEIDQKENKKILFFISRKKLKNVEELIYSF